MNTSNEDSIISKTQYSTSEYAWNWYNILSNLISIIPTILFMNDYNYYDAIIVLGTGVSSFLYHINNNTPDVYKDDILGRHAIQITDSIMSYTLIFQITTYLVLYKNYYIRSILLFIYLPLEIYSINYNELYNVYFLLTIIVIFLVFICYNLHLYRTCRKKHLIILCIGLSMSAVEILMYAYLQKQNYNAYHSMHHTLAFISIIFYHYIPRKYMKEHNINPVQIINIPTPVHSQTSPNSIRLRIYKDYDSPSISPSLSPTISPTISPTDSPSLSPVNSPKLRIHYDINTSSPRILEESP
jgi:hypothetical protein